MPTFTSASHVALPASHHSSVRPTLHVSNNSAIRVSLSTGDGRRTSWFEVRDDVLGFQSTGVEGAYDVTLVAGSHTLQLDGNRFDRQSETSANAEQYFDEQSGQEAHRFGVLKVDHEGEDFLILGSPNDSGVYALSQSGGSWQTTDFLGDTGSSYLGSPHVFAQYQSGSDTLIFAASLTESGVTSMALADGGTLTRRDSLGADDGLGISQPTCLTIIEVDANPILLVGSAQSGTLTSMSISPSGSLAVLDHVEDSLNTRFGQTAVLEAATLNGLTYVIAGGGDDGLTAFALLPDGRLVHLDSLADTAQLGLSNVNSLKLASDGDMLHIFASSEDTPGLTHVTIDTAAFGGLYVGGITDEEITGGLGDNLLADGAGSDTLVEVHCAAYDKVAILEPWLAHKRCEWGNLLFVGNDVNDIAAMQRAGLCACPSDAHPEVLTISDWILPAAGGRGALRAMADFLLAETCA